MVKTHVIFCFIWVVFWAFLYFCMLIIWPEKSRVSFVSYTFQLLKRIKLCVSPMRSLQFLKCKICRYPYVLYFATFTVFNFFLIFKHNFFSFFFLLILFSCADSSIALLLVFFCADPIIFFIIIIIFFFVDWELE